MTPVASPIGADELPLSPILTPSVEFVEDTSSLERFQETDVGMGGGAIFGIVAGVVIGVAIGVFTLTWRKSGSSKESIAWSSQPEPPQVSNLQTGRRFA